MQEVKLPRREREKLRHRRQMLAAALALFSEKGYHNVSMHEIAESAEFAIGTLYRFFANKEDLYRALMLEHAEKFHEALTKALETPDDEIEKLRHYVRVKGEVFGGNLSFVQLFLAESRGARVNIKARLDEEVRKGYDETLERLASVFKRGMTKKRFKRIGDPYALAVALDSVVNAFLLLSLEWPDRYPYPEDPDKVLDILFRGVLET
ncbi:MAG TPA: TetR/AcrR family transcriptional regulator [Candidatus Hydrogenedentes bacterium]|nr:TetR/AcrR family transcriptional regulator [Candidatus Hydrogenedentota bacterium]